MNEQQLVSNIEAHKAAASVILAWLVRETPVIYGWLTNNIWPKLVSIYPYCKTNGGVCGIIRTFFVGERKS